MGIYELLDLLRSRPMLAVAAFAINVGVLSFSFNRRKVIYTFQERVSNKKRLRMALENYGLR